MQPAARIRSLDISLIRQIAEGGRPTAIPLGIGEPTWDLPEQAQRVLHEFSGRAPYGAGTGLSVLRHAVASFYNVSFDEVIITQGSIGGLFSLLQAWVGPGDKVLIPDPGFVTYGNLIAFTQAEAVTYLLNEQNRFRLDISQILTRLNDDRIKAVIINHPSNPTGAGCSSGDLARLGEECNSRGILLISDEVYRDLYFGDRPVSLRDVSKHGVVVSSVSKAWGAPGLRVGWMVGSPEILTPARTVHSYATTSPSYVAQKAAIALIENSSTIHTAARVELNTRWEALRNARQNHFGVNVEPPDGTFYHFMKLPESAIADPISFAIKIRDEADVVVIPGLVFGERGRSYMRVSFAAKPEQIEEGIRRLAPYWR
jgi:aspartate/methionine/tyrosine aminotransferase